MDFLFWVYVTDMTSWREKRIRRRLPKTEHCGHAMQPFGHAVGPGEGKGCFGSIKYAQSKG